MLDQIKGYKTYIGCAVIFILGGLFALGVISREEFEAWTAIAGALTGAAMRSALN